MTELKQELRHYCRNPRCRGKLPAPASNPREALCTKGYHGSYYRSRCLVCEAPMERKMEHQLVCGKRGCRNALRAGLGFGRYHVPFGAVSPVEKAIKPGLKSGVGSDSSWPASIGLAIGRFCESSQPADRSPRTPTTAPSLVLARLWRKPIESTRLTGAQPRQATPGIAAPTWCQLRTPRRWRLTSRPCHTSRTRYRMTCRSLASSCAVRCGLWRNRPTARHLTY